MWAFCKEKFQTLREGLLSYTRKERAFILFAMLCGFFICCEYSVIRPVSSSLFISAFSSKMLPYVWIAVVPLNFLLVSFYNRLVPKWGSKKIFTALALLVVLINVTFALLAKNFPTLSFLFYMWKEVYVLMMFQLVWSVIHANINFGRAKYLYGIFFGVGALGSVLGSTAPSFFAVAYGSENLVLLTFPIYLMLGLCYFRMSHYCNGDVPKKERDKEGGFLHGLQLIRSSRFLIFALLIVVFMQTSSAIVDFQFNDFLERTFSQKDVRTEYSARVLGAMHTLTLALQFIGAYVLINWMGFRKSHYFVPSMLAVSATFLVLFPVFSVVSLAFITCKALDFSIFGVIREMLYVPLKPDEKFRAKAVIDVFAHRSSKALASLLILLVTSFVSSHMLSWLSLTIAMIWIFSVAYGLREYEKITRAQEAS